MRKFAYHVRCNFGRKCIPVDYTKHMSTRINKLESVYQEGNFEFDDIEKSNIKMSRPVIWAEADKLLDKVLEQRELVGDFNIKIMADSGQGFMKLTMSVFPKDDSDVDCDIDIKKRRLYAESQGCSEKQTLTSVHKVIILCIVPKISETYDNLKTLVDLTKLNKIPFRFIADFKLILIVNNQQTASSTYPCPYCFVTLQCLRCRTNDEQSNNYDNTLKTYGDLRRDYNNFLKTGQNKKLAKECNSVINAPLFDENDDTCVIEKCVIPELHIMMGFTNHLFWKGIVPIVGREKALIWPTKLSLTH